MLHKLLFGLAFAMISSAIGLYAYLPLTIASLLVVVVLTIGCLVIAFIADMIRDKQEQRERTRHE